jgi:formate C-acetyltransferase
MKNCVDVHQGKMDGAVILGSWDPIGFGTAVDSLVAIKKLVYDDKLVSMGEMIEALENNFEGKEVIRQRCLNAPKYGNNDLYADSIGREIEDFARSISHRYTTLNGGKLDVRFVPITSHVPLGKIVWATPNGRKAKEPLSEGISPTQGADHKGPTATLISIARTKESKYIDGAARLLNVKLTPSAVAGDLGTKRLSSLIRTWCDLKLWHIQFNIINSETLKAAQKNPEKYTNLLVRVAGYSAYFVDLSLDLQNEIIWRTEHNFPS